MEKVVQEEELYRRVFTEEGELTTTIAFLKFMDGKLWLMYPSKAGKPEHLENLDNLFSEYINCPIQIRCKRYSMKIEVKTDETSGERKVK